MEAGTKGSARNESFFISSLPPLLSLFSRLASLLHPGPRSVILSLPKNSGIEP